MMSTNNDWFRFSTVSSILVMVVVTNCITVHAADPPPARKVIIDNDDLEYLGNKEVNEVVTAAWEIYNEQKLFDQKNALVNKISCSTRIHNNDHIQWGHKSYADGEYAGDLKNGLRDGLGKHVMAGGVFEGCWKNDLEDGQGIFIDHSDDSIYFGTWVGGERRGRGVQLKHGSMERYSYHENGEINKIEKMSLLYNNKGQTIGADNGSREKRAVLETVSYISTGRAEEHRYFLASRDSSRQKPLTVNYENINHLLNLDKVGELNDLIRKGAIAGVGDFSELKSYARDLVEDILYGGGIICRDGGSRFMVLPSSNGRAVMMGSDESYLLLLASIKSVDDLKRIRFQMVGTLWREGTMTKESYRDIRFFRESTGTLEITDQAADEYLAIIIGGSIPHAASAIVDIKKIREMDPDFGNERFFYIYDSLRNEEEAMLNGYDYFFGALSKRVVGFLNRNIQEPSSNSCQTYATAAVLTAASNPQLIVEIINKKTELYDLVARNAANSEFNEFELKTMLKIQEIFDDLDLGKTREVVTDLEKNKKEEERNVLSILVANEEKQNIRSMCRNRNKYLNNLGKLGKLACELDEKLSYRKNITKKVVKK